MSRIATNDAMSEVPRCSNLMSNAEGGLQLSPPIESTSLQYSDAYGESIELRGLRPPRFAA